MTVTQHELNREAYCVVAEGDDEGHAGDVGAATEGPHAEPAAAVAHAEAQIGTAGPAPPCDRISTKVPQRPTMHA